MGGKQTFDEVSAKYIGALVEKINHCASMQLTLELLGYSLRDCIVMIEELQCFPLVPKMSIRPYAHL